MKCKLATKTRGCFLKACTKRKSGCPYEYGPDNSNIPLTLPNGLFQRRHDALIHYWRVLAKFPKAYSTGFKTALGSLLGTSAGEIWGVGRTSDELDAYRFGVEAALTARDEGDKDRARRARWEAGAIRRGELSESEREYSRGELTESEYEYPWGALSESADEYSQ